DRQRWDYWRWIVFRKREQTSRVQWTLPRRETPGNKPGIQPGKQAKTSIAVLSQLLIYFHRPAWETLFGGVYEATFCRCIAPCFRAGLRAGVYRIHLRPGDRLQWRRGRWRRDRSHRP